MNQGINLIIQQIVNDIQNPESNLFDTMKNSKVIVFYDEYHQKLSGKLVDEVKDYYVIRNSDDGILIINKNDLALSGYI